VKLATLQRIYRLCGEAIDFVAEPTDSATKLAALQRIYRFCNESSDPATKLRTLQQSLLAMQRIYGLCGGAVDSATESTDSAVELATPAASHLHDVFEPHLDQRQLPRQPVAESRAREEGVVARVGRDEIDRKALEEPRHREPVRPEYVYWARDQ